MKKTNSKKESAKEFYVLLNLYLFSKIFDWIQQKPFFETQRGLPKWVSSKANFIKQLFYKARNSEKQIKAFPIKAESGVRKEMGGLLFEIRFRVPFV